MPALCREERSVTNIDNMTVRVQPNATNPDVLPSSYENASCPPSPSANHIMDMPFADPNCAAPGCYLAWRSASSSVGKNVTNVLMRNAVSVGLPTAIREGLRHAISEAFSDTVKIGLGGAAILMPLVLEIVGAYRDSQNGTATATTMASRAVKGTLVLAAGIAAVSTGMLAAAGPALATATFLYAPLRDLVQYFLQLRDNNPDGINAAATVLSAGIYGINQTLVFQAMTTLVTAFEPEMGKAAANAAARAIMNIIGETLDEFTYRGLTNCFAGRSLGSLDITLSCRSFSEINASTAADQVFNSNAGRSGLCVTALATAFALPWHAGWANSAATAASLSTGYPCFIYGHDQRRPSSAAVPHNQSTTRVQAGQQVDYALAFRGIKNV